MKNQNLLQSLPIEFSSRRRRFGAYIIDELILTFVAFIIGFVNGSSAASVLIHIIPFLYFSLFLISSWWATPGQRILRIYVCKADDFQGISFLTSVVRFLIFRLVLAVSAIITVVIVFGSLKQAAEKIPDLYNKSSEDREYIQYIGNKNHYKYSYRDEEYIESEALKDPREKKAYEKIEDSMGIDVYEISLPKIDLLAKSTSASSCFIAPVLEPSSMLNMLQLFSLRAPSNMLSEAIFPGSLMSGGYISADNEEPLSEEDRLGAYVSISKMLISTIAIFFIIYSVLLVGSTFLSYKKQTVYDLICNSCVARGKSDSLV